MAKLNAKGAKLTDLITKLEQPVESKEIRFTISEDDFGSYGNQVLVELEKKVNQMDGWELVSPNYEGIRVRCTLTNEKGWFLLRMSLHDPVMPLNIESEINGGVQLIGEKLKTMLQDFHSLNTEVLRF